MIYKTLYSLTCLLDLQNPIFSDAFVLDHMTLKIHQADEFELLETPEILNLSNKTQTGESRIQESM